jgi:hypothetical protein
VPTATANPESSGGSDGPIGDDGGDDSGDDGANHGAGPDATGTGPGVEDSTSPNITGRRLMTPSRRLLESLASLPVPFSSSSSPCAVTSTVPASRAVSGPSPRLAPTSAARGATVASVQPFEVSATVATVPSNNDTPSVSARGSSVAVLHMGGTLVAKPARSRHSRNNNSRKGRTSSSIIGGNTSNTAGSGSVSGSISASSASSSSSSRSSRSSSSSSSRRKSSKRQKKRPGTPSEFLSYQFEYEAPPSSDGEDLQQEDPPPSKRRVAVPSKVPTYAASRTNSRQP